MRIAVRCCGSKVCVAERLRANGLSHQKGFYLPKKAWRTFSNIPPEPGINREQNVQIEWQDGRTTSSTIKWYGEKKSEYRLTGFNRRVNFPFLTGDRVGSLFILIPIESDRAAAFMLDEEEDMEVVQAALGVDATISRWAVFDQAAASEEPQSAPDCLQAAFELFASKALTFPSTAEVSAATLTAMNACQVKRPSSFDKQLEAAIQAEYQLFRILEKKIVEDAVVRGFNDLESFLLSAQSILQRRKSRAGKSLEFHVEEILRKAHIPFQSQVTLDDTRPDIVIPHSSYYYDETYPRERVFVVALKTTCKDRWRQILQEAPKVSRKYLLTLQPGISKNQVCQMIHEGVQLVVPAELHRYYSPEQRANLLTMDQFIATVRESLPKSSHEHFSPASGETALF